MTENHARVYIIAITAGPRSSRLFLFSTFCHVLVLLLFFFFLFFLLPKQKFCTPTKKQEIPLLPPNCHAAFEENLQNFSLFVSFFVHVEWGPFTSWTGKRFPLWRSWHSWQAPAYRACQRESCKSSRKRHLGLTKAQPPPGTQEGP